MKQILLFFKLPRPKDTEVETPQMSPQHTAGVTKTGLPLLRGSQATTSQVSGCPPPGTPVTPGMWTGGLVLALLARGAAHASR